MNSEKIIDYLSLLGIIDENKINNFLNIFSEIIRNTNNNNNFDNNNNIDILKLSLFSFLRNISKNDKNLFELSRNIILSYNKFVTKEFYKKLENVKWILYLKIKKIFINFLFKTVQFALKKENYESRNKKFKSKNYDYNDEYINNSLKKFHPIESNNFNSHNINLNRNNFQNINNSNIPIKSFTYYSSAKNIQQKIPFNSENFSTNYFNNNININNNNININNNNINYLKDYYDFYENENNHIERVNEKILNLKVQKMNELEQNCTFSPKINTNYQIKSNIYNNKVLYEDNKNDNNEKKMKRSKSNFAHFEKLYNEAKIKTEKQKELEKKNFLNDNNFTFKPTISDNKKYKVKTTFNERTNKSIEIRKKKLDDIKNNIHPPLNENFHFDGKKNKNKYSKEEIIDTLYTKQLEKIKEKQNNYKKLNEKNEKKQIIDWKKKFDKMRKLDIERIKNFNRKLLENDNKNDNVNGPINVILDNNNNDEENKNNSIHNTIPDLNFDENNSLNKNNSLKNLKKENSLNNNNNIEINSLSDVNTANNLSNLDYNKVDSEKTETDHINVEAKSNSMRKFLAGINKNNNNNNNNNDENK